MTIIHEDKEVGMTISGTTVYEVYNCHGQHYWYAVAQIESILGSEVNGELKGYGNTAEQAIERLNEERKKLNDSLWA